METKTMEALTKKKELFKLFFTLTIDNFYSYKYIPSFEEIIEVNLRDNGLRVLYKQ